MEDTPKNIIICCDGTGNQFGRYNSNVVKLYSVIEKIPGKQIAYYDPGVGTFKQPGIGFSLFGFLKRISGLATGRGLYQNVYEAYVYLMENYQAGDKVYLFGFSRGAYTVRVLSGFLRMMGLLERGCQNLIPYAFQIYSAKNKDFELAGKFRKQFSRKCPIHFMGLWDTVSSVGYFGNWKSYPYTANNSKIESIRHALAIDERRAFYNQNKLGERRSDRQTIKQVWFSGVHSGVGGSYPELESGLAKIALQWMLNEAFAKGMLVDADRYRDKVLTTNKESVGPDPNGHFEESLSGFWYIMEIIPRSVYNYTTKVRKWYLPLGRYRTIDPEKSLIHETVLERLKRADYAPTNIPEKYEVEKVVELISPE